MHYCRVVRPTPTGRIVIGDALVPSMLKRFKDTVYEVQLCSHFSSLHFTHLSILHSSPSIFQSPFFIPILLSPTILLTILQLSSPLLFSSHFSLPLSFCILSLLRHISSCSSYSSLSLHLSFQKSKRKYSLFTRLFIHSFIDWLFCLFTALIL